MSPETEMRRGVAARRALTGLLLAAAVAGPFAVAKLVEPAEEPVRILAAGDSITHGSAGDHTWRYFLDRHLTDEGVAFDMVGPARDPWTPPGSSEPATYADPDFDSDHGATWGDSMLVPRGHDRDAMLTAYQPDVVVLELGTNDLGYYQQTAEQVIELTRSWVLKARTVVPEAEFVLVEMTWTSVPSAVEYDRLLPHLVEELDTEASPVVLARAARGFRVGSADEQGGDTHDGIHPNVRGQVKIGAAVADALAELGHGGKYPRPLTYPGQGPLTAPTLDVEEVQRPGQPPEAELAWTLPGGASSVDVWMREQGQRWRRTHRAQTGSPLRVGDLAPCVEYDFRVRARKGWTLADESATSRTSPFRWEDPDAPCP